MQASILSTSAPRGADSFADGEFTVRERSALSARGEAMAGESNYFAPFAEAQDKRMKRAIGKETAIVFMSWLKPQPTKR